MTTTTFGSSATHGSFARTMAAEWIRTWSVRSTWWGLLAALGIAVAMGMLFGLDFEGEQVPLRAAGEYTIVIAQMPLLVVAALVVTADYATGAIRSTLQQTPRRGVLVAARTAVAVAVVTTGGVLTALVADLVAWSLLDAASGEGLGRSLAAVGAVVASGALVTIGLAMISRSTAGTLVTVFLIVLALPMMLAEIDVTWLAALGRSLPGISIGLLETFEGLVTRTHTLLVLAAWVGGSMTVGALLFHRRDAG